VRAVDVEDAILGTTGRCDRVEIHADGSMTIVEHKASPVRRTPELTEPMRIQVLLQAHALRSMGHTVRGSAVYFTTHSVRVLVAESPSDLVMLRRHVEGTREAVDADTAPPALEDDPPVLGLLPRLGLPAGRTTARPGRPPGAGGGSSRPSAPPGNARVPSLDQHGPDHRDEVR